MEVLHLLSGASLGNFHEGSSLLCGPYFAHTFLSTIKSTDANPPEKSFSPF